VCGLLGVMLKPIVTAWNRL